MTVTVYTSPTCMQCAVTYRELDRRGIPYRVIDVSTDQAALEHVQALGYRQLPVVETPDGHWSGFRPDKIDAVCHSVGVTIFNPRE